MGPGPEAAYCPCSDRIYCPFLLVCSRSHKRHKRHVMMMMMFVLSQLSQVWLVPDNDERRVPSSPCTPCTTAKDKNRGNKCNKGINVFTISIPTARAITPRITSVLIIILFLLPLSLPIYSVQQQHRLSIYRII